MEQRLEFLTTIIENIPAVVFVKDAKTLTYVLINKAGENYYGTKRESMLGRSAGDVFEEHSASQIHHRDRAFLEAGVEQTLAEHEVVTPGGQRRTVVSKRLPILDAAGKIIYIVGVIDDITERRTAERRVHYMAYHDALTGLQNRFAFGECVAASIAEADAGGGGFSVLFIDLDRFKEINEGYGHQTGDGLLSEVASRLGAAAADAFVARIGGDEFALVTKIVDRASIVALCDRIRATLGERLRVEDQLLGINISVGVATYPGDGPDMQSLLSDAGAALVRAKADGRGVTRFFEPALDMVSRERRELQQDLISAVEAGQFLLHYQPLLRIDGTLVGFEALVRWRHPVRGMIPPGKFIPIAEECGMIPALGAWVLAAACAEAVRWHKPLLIAVNVSAMQVKRGDFLERVRAILESTGLSPDRLELEITEGVLMSDSAISLSTLKSLKALGVRVAMDDFGTGYSSLSYLQSFPFDKIKIDQSFVAGLLSNAQSAAIVRAVIGLGRSLGMPVIAEGVETQEQFAFLAAEACDQVQGYLLGRPRPIGDYAHLTSDDHPHFIAKRA